MTEISPFKSRRQIQCDSFIGAARELCIFSHEHPNAINYDDISWDIRSHIKTSGAPKSASIAFKTAESGRGNQSEPLPGRYGDAIKAVVAMKIWETRNAKIGRSAFQFLTDAAKKLHTVMVEDGLAGDPTQVTRDHLEKALLNAGKSQRHMATPLSAFARIFSESGIAPDLQDWVPIFTRNPAKNSRLKPQRARANLSDDEIGALADAFCAAKTPTDQVITSILAILCCAPARIGEVFALPIDAEVVDNPAADIRGDDVPFDEDVRFPYGLRWWPEKSGPPTVKFVAAEMVPIAQQALQRIRIHTHDARKTASWMIKHPDMMPLPSNLEHVRTSRRITTTELGQLYNIHPETVAAKNQYMGWVRIQTGVYCFESIERHWRAQLPAGWPVLSETSGITYDHALLVSYKYQFSNHYQTDNSVVASFGEWVLTDALVSKAGSPSIFERLDVRLPDGTYPKITTHQIRHYLNTVAQRTNIPQSHIAMWSGRKRVMENASYDHTDPGDLVDRLMSAPPSDITTYLPAIVDDADDAIKAAFIKQNVTSTPIGYCLGDLRFSPCEKAGACIDCTRLACVAGDAMRIENLKRDVDRRRTTVENFDAAAANARRFNPRAREAANAALSHGERLLSALQDPTNHGSIIRNSDVKTFPGFSQADRIIADRKNPPALIEKEP